MKKLIALLLTLVMLLSLAACGKDDTLKDDDDKEGTAQTEGKDDKTTEPGDNKDPVISYEITVENLMNYPGSPEADFEVMNLGDGTCEITKYLGDDEIVVIPENIGGSIPVELSSYLFRSTPTVKAIRLSDSIETIGYAAFSFNENIEIVVFGNGVRELGEAAFMQAEGIRQVVLNEGLETIGRNCFLSCSIQRLEIPGTVKEFGQMAFTSTNIQEVVLGDGITQLSDIDFFTFAGCDSLMSIEIPASVTRIASWPFISLPEEFTIIGEAGSYAEQYAKENNINFQEK